MYREFAKKWNRIIYNASSWKYLDLTDVAIDFNNENWRQVKPLVGPFTSSIIFDKNTSHEVNSFLSLCNMVSFISLSYIQLYNYIDLSLWPKTLTKIEINGLYLLENKFFQLFQSSGILFPRLQVLILTDYVTISDHDIVALLSSKTVKILKLKYCSTYCINSIIKLCPNLITIILHWAYIDVDSTILFFYLWPKTLRNIKINNIPSGTLIKRWSSNMSEKNVETMPDFIHLESLSIINSESFHIHIVYMVICGNITELNLHNFSAVTLNRIIPLCKTLKYIILQNIFSPTDKEKIDLSTWPVTLKSINLQYIDNLSFGIKEPFYHLKKKLNTEKIFPCLEELHLYFCHGFSYRDLLAIGPSMKMYNLTPAAEMITQRVKLFYLFPKLIRINLKSVYNISFANILSWLVNSNATQFEILDQEFRDFNIGELVLKLVDLRIKKSDNKFALVSWIRLTLVHNLLPNNFLPELSELFTDDMPQLTLIIDISKDDNRTIWNQKYSHISKTNVSLDVTID